MEYTLVICYAILNLLIFIWLLHKYSLLSPGMIVCAFYLLIALSAIPAYNMLPEDGYFCQFDFTDIKAWPYVIYLLMTCFLIIPIFKYENYIQETIISLPYKKVTIFAILFVICSFISIYVYGRTILNNSILENLDEIRQNLYEGIQIKAYNNQIEHFALLFSHYFALPAKVIFFYLLTNDRRKGGFGTLLVFSLGCGVLLPGLMDATRTASRSMLIGQFFELTLCYSLFRNYITKTKKTFLFLACGFALAIMLVYSMMVTEARFGQTDDEDGLSSLVCYWGQPTLVFNSQVSQIDIFAYGARFFYPIFELLDVDPNFILKMISQGWGVCFSTLVGDIWQDIGIFTIFIVPLIAFSFNRWISNKSSYGLAEVYVMIYYAITIQRGALVTGYGMCIDIFVTIFTYVLLKYFFSLKNEL